jgi:predicted ATPase
LMIIDNCEHVVDECAELLERLIPQPGRFAILTTSRERLDVDGEVALQIRPLSTSDDSGAVELFRPRAASPACGLRGRLCSGARRVRSSDMPSCAVPGYDGRRV